MALFVYGVQIIQRGAFNYDLNSELAYHSERGRVLTVLCAVLTTRHGEVQ